MDEPETSPLPPLPIGDTLGAPTASPDALRQILRRHRRRQTAIGAAGLVAVLVAGSLGGWAVGRHDRASSAGVRVAAGGQPTTAPQGAAAPTASSQGGAVAGSAPIGTMYAPHSTQLLVRDASDGTRVRLYQQDITGPKIACATGQTCAQPPVPPCVPASFVVAEVSDDQVAGQTGSPLWQPASSGALQTVSTQVVGAGQPQPILVVVARTSAPTAKVSLTTAYGSDVETPTAAGWVALAVHLPADFATDGSVGAPTGKVVAADGGGNAVSSSELASASPIPPACQPPMSCQAAAAPSPSPSTGSSAPSTPAGPTVASGCGCVPPEVKAPPAGAGGAPVQITCSASVGTNGVGSVSSSSGSATASSGTASSGTASSGPASTTP